MEASNVPTELTLLATPVTPDTADHTQQLYDYGADIGEDAHIGNFVEVKKVAVGKGAVSIFAHDASARAAAHVLFDPVATTVDLADEALMDAAVAVSGSAPAYLYAFMEALAAAGPKVGMLWELLRRIHIEAAA